jgi:hypothetical protein
VSTPRTAVAGGRHPLARLRDAVGRGMQVRAGERCEMCAESIGEGHGHVVDVVERTLKCLCRPCFLLFSEDGAGGARYRQVPTRYVALAGGIDEATWDALSIPVSLVFVFHSSSAARPVACYPSPAGATESLLALDAWADVVAANPSFAGARTDVEAVMVRRHVSGGEAYIVPIDACYELVGRLRTCWRGFDGGAEAHAELDAFFGRVRERAGA